MLISTYNFFEIFLMILLRGQVQSHVITVLGARNVELNLPLAERSGSSGRSPHGILSTSPFKLPIQVELPELE